MRALGAAEILTVVEAGDDQHPLDRALTLLLAAAVPGTSRSNLASLSVAERDARLLRLRAATFGTTLHGFAACPTCAERLEFTLDAYDLAALPSNETIWKTIVAGRNLSLRLPDSRDLAAAAACPDLGAARRLLAERCLIAEQPVELADDTLVQIAECLAERAGAADVRLDLRCPVCETAWQILFDIGAFFWAELRTRAGGLLREVDTLARRYGWTESVILSLPARRRQSYLAMAASGSGEVVA